MTPRLRPKLPLRFAGLAMWLAIGMLREDARAQQNGHIWEAGEKPATAAFVPANAPVNSWGGPLRSPAGRETVRSQSPDFGSANPNPGPAPIPVPGGGFAPTPGV